MNATDERDFTDLLHISWWDQHRSEIREPNVDANGRTHKRGLDFHCDAGPCSCPDCNPFVHLPEVHDCEECGGSVTEDAALVVVNGHGEVEWWHRSCGGVA